MLEKKIKDEYKLGQRQGITELDDYFYIPVRITGSGYNLRKNRDDELILADRNQAEFFSPAFIEHCKSLPIIVNHPENKDMLRSENLNDNAIIGNTIDAWIKGDELWGIARIYDKSLLEKIASGSIKSTSPGVRIIYANDSDPIINTEIPYDINHLAFCEKGHWDKDGQSIGFDNSKHERIRISFNANDSALTNENKIDTLNEILTNKKGEALMQTDNANDIAPVVAGALGGAAAAKATDGELEIKHNSDEQPEEKAKINDAYESNENKLKHSVQNSGTPSVTRDSADEDTDEGENANDADTSVGKSKNLEKAASIMATASHAGLGSQAKSEEAKEEKAMPEIKDEKEEKKQEENKAEEKQEEKKEKANDEELVDSETETDDDKERESELKEMRKVCDSADANLGVKMPFITGRQTLRSIAHKFVTANKGFVDKKYANLALDSYTPELAKEVLKNTYANIMAKSEVKEPVKQNGYVLQSDGSFIKFD